MECKQLVWVAVVMLSACANEEGLGSSSNALSITLPTAEPTLPKPIEAGKLIYNDDLIPADCRFLSKIAGRSPDSTLTNPRFMLSLVCVDGKKVEIVAQIRGALSQYAGAQAHIEIEVQEQSFDTGMGHGGMGNVLIVGPKSPGSPKYPDLLAVAQVASNLAADDDFYFPRIVAP